MKAEGTPLQGSFLGLNYLWGDAPPVSYTHLDVYKRQVRRIVWRRQMVIIILQLMMMYGCIPVLHL